MADNVCTRGGADVVIIGTLLFLLSLEGADVVVFLDLSLLSDLAPPAGAVCGRITCGKI